MIQMYHVYMSYGRDSRALVDINLRIGKAEYVFVTGPSGAGKTSLLRLMMMAQRAEAGQILLFGKNISKIKAAQVAEVRRRMGVVFQDFKLLPLRTVDENVAVGLEILGKSRREIRRKTAEVLRLVNLEHKAQVYPTKLSGGEQQRVAIARALVNDPAILLADEPTGNLDQDFSQEVDGLLDAVCARGTTVIVASHDQAWVDRKQKRVVRIERGRIVSGGIPEL